MPKNEITKLERKKSKSGFVDIARLHVLVGFSDEKQIRKQKHKRARNKSKQRRKLCKDDIGKQIKAAPSEIDKFVSGKPLVESYSHMAHIGIDLQAIN